jgi:hypothetical protein
MNKLFLLVSIVFFITSCNRKKCLTCTDVTYKVAKQSDYDAGYMPDKEHSCVGETYFKDDESHKYTLEELEEKKKKYDNVGNYQCEWD